MLSISPFLPISNGAPCLDPTGSLPPFVLICPPLIKIVNSNSRCTLKKNWRKQNKSGSSFKEKRKMQTDVVKSATCDWWMDGRPWTRIRLIVGVFYWRRRLPLQYYYCTGRNAATSCCPSVRSSQLCTCWSRERELNYCQTTAVSRST